MSDITPVRAVKENPLVAIHKYLDSRKDELKKALPDHIPPEKFLRVVTTALQQNPNLAACDLRSLWLACLACATDGLLPDGKREAVFLPFKGTVQYLPMYQGFLKKFRNSGEFKSINAYIVYQDEPFEHWIDEGGEHFKHVPGDERDFKKIRRVYASATTLNGGSFIADLSMAEINKRRAMSRATREDSPWEKWPEQMMRKTAIRELAKFLPMSSDLERLLQHDEGGTVEMVDEPHQAMAASSMTAMERFAQEDEPVVVVEEQKVEPPDYEKLGRAAHNQGVQREKPPGELRTQDRAADLELWRMGWDSVK